MLDRSVPADTWYTEEGQDNDVVLSSRVRVSRNLDGFPFPLAIKADDAERVQSLVFDAFNHLDNPDQYQILQMSNLDALGRRILSERGVIEADCGNEPWRGLIVRNDGVVSVTVNMDDHVRISAFSAGLSLYSCNKSVRTMEELLQKKLDFSSLPGFGYLSSSLFSTGTGLKISALVCLEGLALNGLLDRIIRDFLANGFVLKGFYGQQNGLSLGCLYQISNLSASRGDSDSQLLIMNQAVSKLVSLERKSRSELLRSKPTVMEDTIFRAIVTAKYARLLPFAEAIELINKIKLGVNLALIQGVGNHELTALLYRIQNAHLHFVLSGDSITIESDIVSEETRMDRLRAMIVQEVLKDADIRERRG